MSFVQRLSAELYLYPNTFAPHNQIIESLEDLDLLANNEVTHATRPFWDLVIGLGEMHKTWALHNAIMEMYNGEKQAGNKYFLEWEQIATLKDLMRRELETETDDCQRGNLLHAERVLSDTLAMRSELTEMLAELYYWHEGD